MFLSLCCLKRSTLKLQFLLLILIPLPFVITVVPLPLQLLKIVMMWYVCVLWVCVCLSCLEAAHDCSFIGYSKESKETKVSHHFIRCDRLADKLQLGIFSSTCCVRQLKSALSQIFKKKKQHTSLNSPDRKSLLQQKESVPHPVTETTHLALCAQMKSCCRAGTHLCSQEVGDWNLSEIQAVCWAAVREEASLANATSSIYFSGPCGIKAPQTGRACEREPALSNLLTSCYMISG